MTRTATLWIVVCSVSLSAQTTPPSTPTISVTGCVAQVQRDGSLGAKATGTSATPENATTEANNPEPTNRYQLTDATPVPGGRQPADTPPAAKSAQSDRTVYALRGHEPELEKHLGHRVEISGALMPPLAAKLPSKAAATAEGIRTVQVASVKMIGMTCSAK